MLHASYCRIGKQYSAGQPRVTIMGSSHRGASLTARELSNWYPVAGSADADLLPELPVLVPRSRDLLRNNGIAAGALQTLRDNIVGSSWRLAAIPDYRALGRDKDWAEEWSQEVESRWRAYAETSECDITGRLNFTGLTLQVFTAGMMNGEAIALPLWEPRAGSRFATRFQLIESDRLSNPNDEMDSDRRRGGVDFDGYGRPLGYWIRKAHPGDWYGLIGIGSNLQAKWERIPAETAWGRKRVIHVHDAERTGQTRGKPILTPILGDFKMYDHYVRTELQAAVVNALIAAFIETPLDSPTVAQMFGADPSSAEYQKYLQQRREYVSQLKGGAIIPVYPGDKLTAFTPNRPGSSFEPFLEVLAREIGAGIGLPKELLLKDFSKSNYSSARAALLEAWRFFMGRRTWLSTYWASPAYALWLEEMVNAGEIEAPEFYENWAAYCRCRWIGSGRGWVDPVKEAQASQIRMASNLSTLEHECAEQGLDWVEVLEQRAREQRRIEELGLETQPPVVTVPTDDEDEEDEEREAKAGRIERVN